MRLLWWWIELYVCVWSLLYNCSAEDYVVFRMNIILDQSCGSQSVSVSVSVFDRIRIRLFRYQNIRLVTALNLIKCLRQIK